MSASVVAMDFAMSSQARATKGIELLRAAGHDDASYEGRRTGVSGHIIRVSADQPGEPDHVLRLVKAVDPDAQSLD